jgi:hypothetical protein
MTRTIIKVAVVLVLILLLLGISVMKSTISAKKEDPKDVPKSRPDINKIVTGQILDSARIIIDSLSNLELQYRLKIDSLEMLLAAAKSSGSRREMTEAQYRDSLQEVENYYRDLISSLHKLYGTGSVSDSSRAGKKMGDVSIQNPDPADSVISKSAPQSPAKEKTEIDR